MLRLAHWMVFLSVLGILPSLGQAAVPNKSPDELKKDASLVVVGKVVENYGRAYKDKKGGTRTAHVIELEVDAVEKGTGVKRGEVIFICASTAEPPPASAGKTVVPDEYTGHSGVPRSKDRVRVYVGRGENGRLTALFPNGFETLGTSASK